MKTRKILLILSALVAVALISGIVSTIVVAAWPFVDVGPGHWAYNSIKWLYDNKITTGYGDNTYRPNNTVQRDEMAAFLHRQAGALVAAGAHVVPKEGGGHEIKEWFNNVNGQKPTQTWFFAHGVNFGFDMSNKLVQCTVDMDDSVTSFCSAKTGNNQVLVAVYDLEADVPALGTAGFWVLVYGHDIQP